MDRGQAINLLVNCTQSILVSPMLSRCPQALSVVQMPRAVHQLESRPCHLCLYLDALFQRDRHLGDHCAGRQVRFIHGYVTGRGGCSSFVPAQTVCGVCTKWAFSRSNCVHGLIIPEHLHSFCAQLYWLDSLTLVVAVCLYVYVRSFWFPPSLLPYLIVWTTNPAA